MRNARRNKIRDLRKAFFSGDGPKLHKLYVKIYNDPPICFYDPEAHQQARREDEWICKQIGMNGCDPVQWFRYNGDVPAHYRRSLNRRDRTKAKMDLIKAEQNCDFDDFSPRKHCRDALGWWL